MFKCRRVVWSISALGAFFEEKLLVNVEWAFKARESQLISELIIRAAAAVAEGIN